MGNFSDIQIQAAWNKASTVPNYDSAKFRKDPCGAWIQRDQYGSPDHAFGWEIDHAYPQSKGGDDSSDNIRAMHSQNNRSKADDYPSYSCALTSEDTKNVPAKDKRMTLHDDVQSVLKQKYRIT